MLASPIAVIAKEIDTTLPALALSWVLRQPNVASVLVGASRPEQIEANVEGVKLELSADVVEKINEILA
ncbi:aldo/keto reductase [Bacillus sp. IITD106]|nr:aldo/keto reductase [Bacillus sp. IITD106]